MHIRKCQLRVVREEFIQIRGVFKVLEHHLNSHSSPLNRRLPGQNGGVLGDATGQIDVVSSHDELPLCTRHRVLGTGLPPADRGDEVDLGVLADRLQHAVVLGLAVDRGGDLGAQMALVVE